ncbi:acyltransferase [Sphingomonas gilva]|uniref:Acyltransferase n=1 Tax=Sphingomonas gilva TaxID=2305907 RepID=A0A396RWJ4_9SPHN|nr:acyltransferase family protein [Sphingomonas gilva]RHW18843.1 acyltransferase [Sphingomonas gilva]
MQHVSQAARLAYRRDIDGLRAVAVVPVVLFHAGAAAIPGGFIGVDIFFVISGYLITGILLGEADRGRVSIARFYERRVRRIGPALLVVLAATFLAAHLLLFPAQYVDFAKSLLAAEGFVSNIWFWTQAGYFKAQGDVVPLLHTWSLAVEEQFYIFMPLAVALLARRPALLRWSLAAAALASLALSIFGTIWSPGATFYWLPTRAWELLLGALLAAGMIPRAADRWRPAIAWLGLALIAVGLVAIDERTPFPGAAALLPCLGAAAILHSGDGTPVGRLLSFRPMVAIGLISYSLYLWHWPVLVLGRQLVGGDLGPLGAAAAVALSFALATLSYWFVEQPTRNRLRVRSRPLVLACAAGALALALLALWVIADRGKPARFSPELVAMLEPDRDTIGARCRDRGECRFGPGDPDILLLGDSHAAAMAEGVEAAARPLGRGGELVTVNACPPLIGFTYTGLTLRDARTCKAAIERAVRNAPATVVLAANWPTYLAQDRQGVEAALRRTIDALGRRRIIILAGLPRPEGDLPWATAVAMRNGDPHPRVRPAGRQLVPLDLPANATMVDLERAFCPDGRCLAQVAGRPTFSDTNHPSAAAARRLVAPALAPALAR